MTGDKDSGRRPSGVVAEGIALKTAKKYLPEKSAKILDFGCGPGFFLLELQKAGYKNIAGIDVMKYDLADGSLKNLDIKIESDQSQKLPWTDNNFDAVTAWEVLEHVENPRFVVREAKRILKPGGIFMISIPNAFHIMSKLFFLKRGDLIRWSNKNDHFNVFTKKIFKKVFLQDFELVETIYASSTFGQGLDYNILHKLDRFRQYLPENELFANYATYIMKKKF